MNTRWLFSLLLLFLLLCIPLTGCKKSPQKEARVTFQFDHPYISQYLVAKPLFDSKGIKATLMVSTGDVEREDYAEYFMSWDQLMEMYNEGWEIGAHSVTHPDLRSADEATIRYELSQSKAILESHGFKNINNFAYPYNYYNLDVLYIVSDYFRSARTSVGQTDFRINPSKIHPYELSSYEANLTIDNVTDAYKYVDKAEREGRWLIFLLHEFRDREKEDITVSSDVTDIEALEMLIDYIQQKNIPIVTTEEALNYYIGKEL